MIEVRLNDTNCEGCNSCCISPRFRRLSPGELKTITPDGTPVFYVDSETALQEATRNASVDSATSVHVLAKDGVISAQVVGKCARLQRDNTCDAYNEPNRPIACGLLKRGERGCTTARAKDGKPPVIAATIRRRGVGF